MVSSTVQNEIPQAQFLAWLARTFLGQWQYAWRDEPYWRLPDERIASILTGKAAGKKRFTVEGKHRARPLWAGKLQQSIDEERGICYVSQREHLLIMLDLDAHDGQTAEDLEKAKLYLNLVSDELDIQWVKSDRGWHGFIILFNPQVSAADANVILSDFETQLRRYLRCYGSPCDIEVKGTIGYLDEKGIYHSGKFGTLPIHRPDFDAHKFLSLKQTHIRRIELIAKRLEETVPQPAGIAATNRGTSATQARSVTLDTIRDNPDALMRALDTVCLLARQQGFVPTVKEALKFYRDNDLFSGDWSYNERDRKYRFAYAVKHCAKTFDPALAKGTKPKLADPNGYKAFVRAKCPRMLAQSRRDGRVVYVDRTFKQRCMSVIEFCTRKEEINQDGTIPHDRIEAIYKAHWRGWDNIKYAAFFRELGAIGVITVNRWQYAKGHFCRDWERGKEWPEKKPDSQASFGEIYEWYQRNDWTSIDYSETPEADIWELNSYRGRARVLEEVDIIIRPPPWPNACCLAH